MIIIKWKFDFIIVVQSGSNHEKKKTSCFVAGF